MNKFLNLNLGFNRKVTSMAKMQAYYTNKEICRIIGNNYLLFPEKDEVCCLEPCIGDAEAVCAITSKKSGDNKKLFGVEINNNTYRELLNNEKIEIEALLNADFLNGVKIKNKAFSFCFCNPPYDEHDTDDSIKAERMEILFLDKISNYIMPDGILVFVIPYSVYIKEKQLRSIFKNYEVLGLYKMPEAEFAKYKQIICFLKRKKTLGYLKKDLDIYLEELSLDKIPVISADFDGKKIVVPPSLSKNVNLFAQKDFRAEEVWNYIINGEPPIYKRMENYLTEEQYSNDKYFHPPIQPKNDSLFLMAMTGVGEGVAGIEGIDMHIMRGVAKIVEDTRYEEDEKGDTIEIVTSRTAVSMNIFEENGDFHCLE